ncbi:hypothetical protein CR513_59273, partial [Mucuna pruriens]
MEEHLYQNIVVLDEVFAWFGKGTADEEDIGLIGLNEVRVILVGAKLGPTLAQDASCVWIVLLVGARGFVHEDL